MKIFFWTTGLLFLISSCGLYRPDFIETDDGRQARQESYHLKGKSWNRRLPLDTNSVYVCENEYLITGKNGQIIEGPYIYYDFIRFESNGVAFIRTLIPHKPTNEDFNYLKKGQFCFFEIKEDILLLEIYNFSTKVFEYQYGKIQGNGDISFFKKKGRPWWAYKGPLNKTFKKEKVILYTRLNFPN